MRGRLVALAVTLCAVIVFGSPPSASAQVPAPSDIIGFAPGEDYRLAPYGPIVEYFRALDAASDRVLLTDIGISTLGRPLLLAAISSAANIANLDYYREISERLARVKGLGDAEARQLARDGKAIIWIDGGLHATEVAPGQMTPELAHWIATDEGDEARLIRDQAIVLVMPNMNPDGLDIVAEWYAGHVGTEFETAPVPELSHHYAGHDNNRDWYMFTQAESRAVARQLYNVWFPQIVYNHHQPGTFPARIWVPPFANPVNPNLDPEIVTSLNFIGEAMKNRFNQEEKPGVVSGVVYDLWWNGGMRGAPNFHNMLGLLSETAGGAYATPRCYEPDELPDTFNARAGHLPARRPTTSYTDPWQGGCWTMRDAMDYMITGSKAVMAIGAKLKTDYLYNIYRMGRRQIEKAIRAEGGPFAYVIDPAAQHDAGAAIELLRVFLIAGIEIRQADVPFTAEGVEYPVGTYVFPPQAFRPFVVDLMEPKAFPDRRQYPGGPPATPYDTTGYELRLQMGVAVDAIDTPFGVPARIVDDVPPPPGGLVGTHDGAFLLTHDENNSAVAVNRLLAAGATVQWSAAPFEASGRDWPAGTFIVEMADRADAQALGLGLGLTFQSLAEVPPVARHRLRAPRIGLYKGFTGNTPEGWTRWLLERYEFRYENLSNTDIQDVDLSSYDIIVLPDQSASSILEGHPRGRVPPDYVGGIGDDGVRALTRYVEGGGWLMAIDQASDFAIEQLGLPVRNTVRDTESSDFFVPGSLIRLDLDPNDPLTYGMPTEGIAFFVSSQVFDAVERRDVEVFSRYARDEYLASGWALGAEDYLAGGDAGVRVSLGDGQVVLHAFEPTFRAQPHGTFKLFFNPLFASTVEEPLWAPGADERAILDR
jgi:hypothetical protein